MGKSLRKAKHKPPKEQVRIAGVQGKGSTKWDVRRVKQKKNL